MVLRDSRPNRPLIFEQEPRLVFVQTTRFYWEVGDRRACITGCSGSLTLSGRAARGHWYACPQLDEYGQTLFSSVNRTVSSVGASSPMCVSSGFGLETFIGLLTGQSVPIFRCARERRSMPIVMFLTTSDHMRPIRIPTSAGGGAERPAMDPTIRCPIRRLCCLPTLQEPLRFPAGPQMEGKHEHACSS
jgi:hypothetical protein